MKKTYCRSFGFDLTAIGRNPEHRIHAFGVENASRHDSISMTSFPENSHWRRQLIAAACSTAPRALCGVHSMQKMTDQRSSEWDHRFLGHLGVFWSHGFLSFSLHLICRSTSKILEVFCPGNYFVLFRGLHNQSWAMQTRR